jgi:putative transposase
VEVTNFDPPSHEDVRTDLRALFLGAIRMTLEMMLEEEVRELVGAGRWQKAIERKDRRNGTYLRSLMTSMGHVDVAVPRTRESGSAGEVLLSRTLVDGAPTRLIDGHQRA